VARLYGELEASKARGAVRVEEFSLDQPTMAQVLLQLGRQPTFTPPPPVVGEAAPGAAVWGVPGGGAVGVSPPGGAVTGWAAPQDNNA